MIVRRWTALAKPDHEAHYVAHFRDDVLPRLRKLAGFRGATVLRQPQADGVAITVLTRWDSMDAIRAFAGPHPEVAVVAESARACFVSYDDTVSHHEVVVEAG
jgi:heme-degrading monooxygenase HmoA